MLKKIAIGVVAILAIILGLAATKPNEFAVTREITIKAPPEKIVPLIADFHNWTHWSPWEHLDPGMVRGAFRKRRGELPLPSGDGDAHQALASPNRCPA